MEENIFKITADRWRSFRREFLLSLSESFTDVQSIGKKNTGQDLSNWAKRKSEQNYDGGN
jgi:hypothetical protein